MTKVRGDKGFIQLGNEPRQVRSLRATDTTWQLLGQEAERQGKTIADLIEDWGCNLGKLKELEPLEKNLTEQLDAARLNDDLKMTRAIALLTEALALKPNAGGAIKAKIREALQILE